MLNILLPYLMKKHDFILGPQGTILMNWEAHKLVTEKPINESFYSINSEINKAIVF